MGRTGEGLRTTASRRARHADSGRLSRRPAAARPPSSPRSLDALLGDSGPHQAGQVQVAVHQLHLAAEDLRCAGGALPGGWPGQRSYSAAAACHSPASDAAHADDRSAGLQVPRRAGIEFSVLGSFKVYGLHGRIPNSAFGGRRVRQLVQILLRERGRLVPRDVLVDALWPGGGPADPGANLAVLASRARHALGESSLILAIQGGYAFTDDDRCWVDAESFAADAERGRVSLASGHAEAALRSYRSALALWRGDPFAESLYEEWAQGHRRLFGMLYEESLDGAARAALQLGQATVAMHFARILTERVPLNEEGRLVLMRALAGAGDPAAAIELFRDWRKLLADEMGLDPCAEMSELYQRIVGCEPALDVIWPEVPAPSQASHATPGPLEQSEMLKPTREILDWISDAAFVLDPAARFLYINARGADLAGRPACRVIGRTVREVCTEDRLPGFCGWAEAALKEQAPGHFRGFCPPVNAWFDTALYPGDRGLLAVLRDVTGQVLAEEQVHRALAEVEASRSELECLAARQ